MVAGENLAGKTPLPLEFVRLQVTNPMTESTRENVPDGFAGQLHALFVKEKFRGHMLKS